MGAMESLNGTGAMVTRWRRRRMCVLIAEHPAPAALREVSAAGAFLETNARPPLGASVELHHPEAGAIVAEVRALADDGISIGFSCGDRSVAFALAAIAADMSRPAA
ncbi:MAG TPA: hypothetical protein VLK25_00565 [Allosphingosinicella sp.]|nr:hypothetical protein [Allosphingosinicella sp.]